MGLFGKKKEAPKPKTIDQFTTEELKEFQKEMKGEIRQSIKDINRQIFASERLVKDAQRDLEKKIKEGADRNVLKVYAKNVISARSARDKHMVYRTKLQSVEHSINTFMMSLKMNKIMGSCTDVLKQVNGLASIPELTQNMNNIQMQMEKHGLVTEMVEDAMDDVTDFDVDIDDQTEKFLNELEDKIEQQNKPKQTQQTTQQVNFDDQLKDLMS